MGNWNRTRNNGCPCNGCTDRYTACHDSCGKPEYAEWRKRSAAAKEAERKYRESNDARSDAMKKHMWKRQRWNSKKMHSGSDDS